MNKIRIEDVYGGVPSPAMLCVGLACANARSKKYNELNELKMVNNYLDDFGKKLKKEARRKKMKNLINTFFDIFKPDKLKRAKKIIKKNMKNEMLAYGIFNSRNLVGDPMETIYSDDKIRVEACYGYGYFEVFGLSDEEFEKLSKYYKKLQKKVRR